MRIQVRDNTFTIWAPAKLNLFLEIQGKRPDGFHEIESLLTAISICDTLSFSATATAALNFSCRSAHGGSSLPVPNDHGNLAWQALLLLRDRFDTERGANVELIKRIPVAAGMGGASSDAAAALVAGNLGWQLNLSLATLHGLAAELGSDVPFFLYRSPAVCRGRGELISSRPYCHHHYVIVMPPRGLHTAEVYAACRIPDSPHRLAAGSQDVQLFNRLQDAAATLTADVGRLTACFDKTNVNQHQLTGSGSAYFGLCANRRQALRAANQLRQLGWNHVLVASDAGGGIPAWVCN